MSPARVQWDRVRRRWILVPVVGLVAAAGSLAASIPQGASYTGRSTLTIASTNRAPSQDAVLAQGYVDYFNLPASQITLRRRAGVTDPAVVVGARIVASSPIIYIEATGRDPGVAQASATTMAVALRDDVDDAVGTAAPRSRQALRGRGSEGTNQLRDLQLDAGVAANPSNAARNAGGALIGGLLFGIVLAAGLGRFENRIVASGEVNARLGLPVLATVGERRRRGRGVDTPSALLRSLTGLVDPDGMPSPGVLAITGPDSARAVRSTVAAAVAGLRATQGRTTLLLQTDLGGPTPAGPLATLPGVSDRLADRGGAHVADTVFSNGRALLVSPPGRRRDDVPSLTTRSRVQRLFREAVLLADLVVDDAPPADYVEGRIVCGAADRSLVVIEEGVTRVRGAVAVAEAVHDAGATALGVVLVRDATGLEDLDVLEGPWAPPVRHRSSPVI